MINSEPKPITAKPATPRPITVPPVKDTFNAFAKLVRAACVVRTLALVAIRIPMKPAKADKKAPVMNEIAMIQLESATVVPDQANSIAAKTTK